MLGVLDETNYEQHSSFTVAQLSIFVWGSLLVYRMSACDAAMV